MTNRASMWSSERHASSRLQEHDGRICDLRRVEAACFRPLSSRLVPRFVILAVPILLLCCSIFAADQFGDAAVAFQRGDFSEAERILKNLLQTQPRDAAALGLLGAVLDAENKFPEAERVYRRALAAEPNDVSLLNNYGNHLLKTGEKAAARAAYLKVVALQRGHPNANLQLAAMAADAKKGTEALRYLDRVPASAQAEPQVQILRMRALFLCGRDKDANETLARLSDVAGHDPRVAFSTGLALAAVGKYQDAENFFGRTLEADPSDFDVLYNLGLAAFRAGNTQRARDVLQDALTERPEDLDTLYTLAVVDIALKQREAAMPLLARAARLGPSRADVQLALAETLSALGYYADALTTYQSYLKLAPGDAAAGREYAFMIGVCGRPEEGIPKLQAILRSHPNDADAHYEIAVLEASSNLADAALHLQKALVLHPDFVPARFARGVLSSLQGEDAAALPDFEFAANHYPDNVTVLDRLGATYLRLDRPGDAVPVLRNAAQIAPRDPRVLLHLSRALSRAGQTEEARATLQRFRAVGADQVNHIPLPGFAEMLSLPPEQLYEQYRTAVEKRMREEPRNAEVNVRHLKLLAEDGDTKEIPGAVQRLLDLNPPALLAAEGARALLNAGQYDSAKALLEYAAKSAPTPEVRLDLAIAVSRTDGAQPALAQLDAMPQAERSGDYYLARAEVLDLEGKRADALSALQHALDLAPTRADLYEYAATFLVKYQRPADAVALFDKAARAMPDDRKILLLQAAMFAVAQRTGDAERVLKHIENRWPEWAASYVTYGILLAVEKRSEEAENQLRTALALGSVQPGAYFYLAKSILGTSPDRLDEAAKAIQQAVALAPGDPWIQALAGRIAYDQKDYQGAVQHLREAVRLRPTYLQARFTLARAYQALGQNEDAERETKELQRLRQQGAESDEESSEVQQLLTPPGNP